MDRDEDLQTRRSFLALAGAGLALSACPPAERARPAARRESIAMQLRRAEERGGANYGWLDTRHTFSFAHYYDPKHMGFRALRVINDDRVSAGGGFPTHPHRDMEIISYVVSGALEHKDSMGHGSVIRPGELQRMTAGTGVLHSEYNPSRQEGVRFLQIWLLPGQRGLIPGYQQKHFGDERKGKLRLVASEDGRQGSLQVNQDVSLYASLLQKGEAVTHTVEAGRHAWLQLVNGAAWVGDKALKEGDGLSTSARGELQIRAGAGGAELLVFDLA